MPGQITATISAAFGGDVTAAISQGTGVGANSDVQYRDTADAIYVYFGVLVGPAWKVNRYSRATFDLTEATVSNNPAVLTLAAAWAARATLIYS